jgi:integrase
VTAIRLRYVHRYRDRHGRVRYYLRRPGHKAVPLPADPGSAQFFEAYQAALAASAPLPREARPGTFNALAASYYASSHFRQLRASTAAVYRRIIERLRADHGDKPVALLDAQGVRRLVEARVETPAAANHVLRTMRTLMAHAVAEKMLTSDPSREVRRLRERKQGAPTWSEEDIAAFEARWPIGCRPRLALALLLYTGQRRSDIVRMGRQHLRHGLLHVRQIKTGAELEIPLHPELQRVLADCPPEHLTFLVTDAGAAYSVNGFYNSFSDWRAAARLPAGLSPHGLRKAAARRLAEAGCTSHEIRSITGHASLAEVERYTRAAEQRRLATAAIARIGKPKRERRLANRRPRIG